MKYQPPVFLDADVIVPPAKPRTARESGVEKYLVARVKALGGEVRKVKWEGRRGAPDRVVMLPNRPSKIRDVNGQPERVPGRPAETVWVELKAPGKAATFPRNAHETAQHREHERMRKMGQRVVVIDSKERVDEVVG